MSFSIWTALYSAVVAILLLDLWRRRGQLRPTFDLAETLLFLATALLLLIGSLGIAWAQYTGGTLATIMIVLFLLRRLFKFAKTS